MSSLFAIALILLNAWLIGRFVRWLWHKMMRSRSKRARTRFTCSYRLLERSTAYRGEGWPYEAWEGHVPIPDGVDPIQARNIALRELGERFPKTALLFLKIEKEPV